MSQDDPAGMDTRVPNTRMQLAPIPVVEPPQRFVHRPARLASFAGRPGKMRYLSLGLRGSE
jgi:hypothetical protein